MNEEQDSPVDEPSPGDAAGPVCGERLAAARREKQISVLEVAKELHLDEPKVRALERNEFDVLGAPVFAKGHLRKYAQLVGANEDDVFADYYQLTRASRTPPIIVGRTKVRHEPSPGPWIAAIIVIVVTAAAYWWFAVRDPGPATPAALPERPVESAAEMDAAPDGDDAVAPAVVAEDGPSAAPAAEDELSAAPAAEDELSAAPAAADAAPPQPEPVAQDIPAGQLRVSLAFTGDCWTEIRDADGQRLFFGMGRAGRTAELDGRPPLSVLLGNADNVSVKVNGNDYAVAIDPSNRTARLTIRNP